MVALQLLLLLLPWDGVLAQPSSSPAPPGPAPVTPVGDKVKSPIFEFGSPEIFVTTESQNFDPYRLVNKYKRTFMLNEYMIFASSENIASTRLLLYDPEETDIVKQNLGKEQYWAFVNSTGTLPSITVSNTTFSITTQFHTRPGDEVSFYGSYRKSFVSKETTPPYDVIFEIPANSRTFRSTKTAVDFQSWGLLRWQLSNKGFVKWTDIKKSVEGLFPAYLPPDTTPIWNVSSANFQRLENPCLPDFFILYLLVGDQNNELHQIYADIPAFHLDEGIPNFYNLTGSFCPHVRTEAHEECGFVQQLVLTNDHVVALTDKGIYVSASLNSSDIDVNGRYDEKPLISYVLVDPCSKFAEYITCFQQGLTSLSSQLIHSVRLFYNPVCNLFQYPFYDDRMVFVIEHTTTEISGSSTGVNSPPVRAITILHASTPYQDWKVLFIGIDKYNGSSILGLVGTFYNHQLRHFDITLKLVADDGKNFHYRRFILPDLADEDSDKVPPGYSVLNGLLGNGFLEQTFPGTFQLEEVDINPGTMDVFFMGSQLWIAESGGPIVYIALSGLSDGQLVKKCAFNHPDRTFCCVNSENTQLIVGRTGSQYTPHLVNIETIEEFWEAAGLKGAYWTEDYADFVIKTAHFTTAFSGNILMWYLHDPQNLRDRQLAMLDNITQPEECNNCAKCKEHIDLVRSCNQLLVAKGQGRLDPVVKEDDRGPFFRMVSINPFTLQPVREATAGPLVPLLVDAATIVLYEVKLPGDDGEYIYFSTVHIGQEITCTDSGIKSTVPTTPPRPAEETKAEETCRVYIRHIKPVHKFLDGFRQVLYGTVMKSIPLHPVGSDIAVLQVPQSNLVFIRNMDPSKFQYTDEHVGQTHHFPGYFSVILQGFPEQNNKDVMWGFSTVHVRSQKISQHEEYQTFLMDMSTQVYREKRLGTRPGTGANEKEYNAYKKRLEDDQQEKENVQRRLFAAKQAVQEEYEKYNQFRSKNNTKLFSSTTFEAVPLYEPIAILRRLGVPQPTPGRKKREVTGKSDVPVNTTIGASADESSKPSRSWTVSDGGCHHNMQLMPNPVLFGHGGRVSLDLHDALSFTIKLRPITELGRLVLYRPLLVVSNSNPSVLRVEKKIENNAASGDQSVSITLTPTGTAMGVSSLVVRSIITSLACETPSSMTFVVQIHRKEGKRLFVNYPIPMCELPQSRGGVGRPWTKDEEDCISYDDILDADKDGIVYGEGGLVKVYTKLPYNYRPPSKKGEQIPLSEYIYNADPSKERYNNWYHVTQDSGHYQKCRFRQTREDCGCTDADKLSDHPAFSDCKELVFTVKRGKSHQISLELDPLLGDEHQIQDFHTSKSHLSVYIEEINGREEFTIVSCSRKSKSCSKESELLQEINRNPELNEGKRYYDASNILITLHGTGLYHFKAGLGDFDSFEEVTGYFILFSDSNELNHIKLIVVMLITITFCFLLVFCGFIRVRRRLSSQLPFQTKAKPKLE